MSRTLLSADSTETVEITAETWRSPRAPGGGIAVNASKASTVITVTVEP